MVKVTRKKKFLLNSGNDTCNEINSFFKYSIFHGNSSSNYSCPNYLMFFCLLSLDNVFIETMSI